MMNGALIGHYERSSSIYERGAVLHYDSIDVEYTGNELSRLRQIKSAKWQGREQDLDQIFGLVNSIRKMCSTCRELKPLTDFYFRKGECKECARQRRRERYHRQRVLEGTCR